MKIALVCPYNMFERAGGVQQIISHLDEGLTQKGHQVKVITQRPAGYKGNAPENYILFGVTRKFKGGLGTQGNWGMPSDSEEIAKVLEAEKFDVIHFHEPWLPLLAWQMLKHSQAAHVATFHANLIDTAAAKSWVNVFMPYGRGIGQQMHIATAPSPAPAALLIDKANSAKERELIKNLKYIPNGVDLKFYRPYKKRQPLNGPGTKTIVYVGRMEKRKGVDWLLMAFAELQKTMPGIHLTMAGAGSRLDKLRQIVRSEKIQNVSFTGYVTDEQKKYLLGNADLACFPALFGESFGIVLLEAMAMGTPLIAGNNIGYKTVMTGAGKIGLVEPQATADFANLAEILLTNGDQRKLMQSWERKEISKYDWAKVINQYEAAYKEAIQIKNRSHANKNGKDEAKKRKTIRRFFVRR